MVICHEFPKSISKCNIYISNIITGINLRSLLILKKRNETLPYVSLVRPILEYGAACWDPYREGLIIALDRVQNKSTKYTHHTSGSNWEVLASRIKLSRICAPYKAYSVERTWKAIIHRLQRSHYLNKVDHEQKIRGRRQIKGKGKFSFMNRTIQDRNQLPADVLGTLHCKTNTLEKTASKAIIEVC
jgi:hypothetical protein